MEITLSELAQGCAGEVIGDRGIIIDGVSTLRNADRQKLSLFTDKRYRPDLESTQAAAILTSHSLAPICSGNMLLVDNPQLALAQILQAFNETTLNNSVKSSNIGQQATIAESAHLGKGIDIGSYVVIGENVVLSDGVTIDSGSILYDDVSIGANTRIDANVTIYDNCHIGSGCHISAGVVIGSDGFGFAETQQNNQPEWVPIPQIAKVRIGHNVHIGANTAIDRGSLDDTLIADGVIIDNLVQIAHNVKIGEHTAIAGCAAIAGSSEIGKNCKIGGRVSIVGHLKICDGVVIYADSLVTKSISTPGIYSSSMPAMPLKNWHSLLAKFRRGLKK